MPDHSHSIGAHVHDVVNPVDNTNLSVPLSTGLSTSAPAGNAAADQTSGPAGSTAVGHSHEAGHWHNTVAPYLVPSTNPDNAHTIT